MFASATGQNLAQLLEIDLDLVVRKFFLKLRQRASAPHRSALRIGAALSAPGSRHYI